MLIRFVLNKKAVAVDVAPFDLLSDVVREHFGLTGTHVGCDTSQCGACVVHIDGRSVKSCSTLAVTLEGTKVTTIEGLADPSGRLHPMQQAFHEAHGLQCGFCTPGMVMSAVDFVAGHPNPTRAEVCTGIEGNFCRCTGYQNIVKSVLAGAAAMQSDSKGV